MKPNEIAVILALRDAWYYLLHNVDRSVDLELLKIYHSIIGKSCEISYRDIGNFRKDIVHILGTSWMPEIPEEERVFTKINEILSKNLTSQYIKNDIDKYIFRNIELFLYLCREQCFMDGNKRVAILMANHYLIQKEAGLFSIKEDIQVDAKMKLINWYEQAGDDKNDAYDIVLWFYDNCVIKK